MTRAIRPDFRGKRSGKIAFVGTYGCWYGAVGTAPYCTAKFALEGLFSCYGSPTREPHMLTVCLQNEVTHFGIQLIISEPGRCPLWLVPASRVELSVATSHLLKAELDDAIPDSNIAASFPVLEKLPYLSAVVQQALQSHTAFPLPSSISPDKAKLFTDASNGKAWTIPPVLRFAWPACSSTTICPFSRAFESSVLNAD